MYQIIYTTDGKHIGETFELREEVFGFQFTTQIIDGDFLVLANSNYVINAIKQ